MFSFRPKLLETLAGYDRASFARDASSGLTVGVLALPLAMAFAIASGMSPTSGIWTAIVAGLIVSLLGGSRVQIGGPTGAFIPIVYGILVHYGVQSLLLATMLAGMILVGMALARLGNLIRFIPRAVVIGFTNGIAVVIFLAQIKDFLGLPTALPAEFFAKIHALWQTIPQTDLPTLGISVASLVVLLGWNRLARSVSWMARLPGPLVVLVAATTVNILYPLPIETIGSRFGGIPQSIPPLRIPELDLSNLGKLISPAITIALLGAIESLLSARVADGLIDDRHEPNQELLAQGIANIAAALFGGFAATGAIARTATNVRSGGRTPVAGIIHAITLLLIVLIAAPLAAHVPLAALSAIVVIVAVNMCQWHEFRELRRYSSHYRTVLIATFLITVVFDLTLAVEIGMVLASLFFIYHIQDLTGATEETLDTAYVEEKDEGILSYRIYGSLFFGTVGKIEDQLDPEKIAAKVLILNLHTVVSLDATALEMLDNLLRALRKRGIQLVLCRLHEPLRRLIESSGFSERLGSENILGTSVEALEYARSLVRKP